MSKHPQIQKIDNKYTVVYVDGGRLFRDKIFSSKRAAIDYAKSYGNDNWRDFYKVVKVELKWPAD